MKVHLVDVVTFLAIFLLINFPGTRTIADTINLNDFSVRLSDTGVLIEEFLTEYNNSDGLTDWTESDILGWRMTGVRFTGLDLAPQPSVYDKITDSPVQIGGIKFNPKPIPEPATIFIFGLSLIGLAYIVRKNILAKGQVITL